jgi:hypothetical protein
VRAAVTRWMLRVDANSRMNMTASGLRLTRFHGETFASSGFQAVSAALFNMG